MYIYSYIYIYIHIYIIYIYNEISLNLCFLGENVAIHYNIFITISCFDYFVLSRCSCLSREVALLVRFPKINLSLVVSEQFSNQLFTYIDHNILCSMHR